MTPCSQRNYFIGDAFASLPVDHMVQRTVDYAVLEMVSVLFQVAVAVLKRIRGTERPEYA